MCPQSNDTLVDIHTHGLQRLWQWCTRPRHRVTAIVVVVALGILAARNVSRGLYYLAVEEPATAAADFYNRRLENAYFLRRVSPQSQNFWYWSKTDPTLRAFAAGADSSERDGSVIYSGLPPWTYVLQLGVFLPSSERVARVYLAGLNISALAVMTALAYEEARRRHATAFGRSIVALSVLAIGATNATLMAGQSSLIVNAGLAAVMMSLNRPANWRWDAIGGIGLAIAMLKPSSALLFVFPPLVQRRALLLGACGVIIGGAWLTSAWWTHLSPIYELQQFARATQLVVAQGANVWLAASARVLPASLARNVFAMLGLVVAAAAAYRLRARPSAAFAVLAIVSRLFTYHRAYDDVLLAFVLIELGAHIAAASSRLRLTWMMVGLSLWLPYSLYMSESAQWIQSVCWVGTAAMLMSDLTAASRRSYRASTAAAEV